MKKILLAILLTTAFALTAKEVCFIPGWYSEWIFYGKHTRHLEKIFPGSQVSVHKWDSNRLWKNAKTSADEFVRDFSARMMLRNDLHEITLIGHSLGGRIVLDCTAKLAAEKKQVRQIILLGTAGKITPEDIRNCQQVSLLPVININCPDDNMLKLFYWKEGFMPLGLAGLPQKTPHFRQYRMSIPDKHIKLFKTTVISRRTAEPFRETAAHLASQYLYTLEAALNGTQQEAYTDIFYLEVLAAENSAADDWLPGFSVVDEFDGWKLSYRKIFPRWRITSPTGKTFYYSTGSAAKNNFQRITGLLQNSK